MTGQDPRVTQKNTFLAGDLRQYVDSMARSPHPYLATIRADAETHKWSFMLTTKDQAAFLYSAAKMVRAAKILEIGTYFGHSSLALAAALEQGGHLYTIEHNPKFARAASAHFLAAGVADDITVITAEAPLVINQILREHSPGSFDLIFIDADKKNFKLYWEAALTLTRKSGVIIFDNMLARGEILNTDDNAPSHIAAVRAFNQSVLADQRAFTSIATIGDGMLLAIKL